MELIKKIKEAEVQAQRIIEQAKADAAAEAERQRQRRLEATSEAQRQRKKAIEAAVAAAESQAAIEAENLKAGAEKNKQRLHGKADKKIDEVAEMVMSYLRG